MEDNQSNNPYNSSTSSPTSAPPSLPAVESMQPQTSSSSNREGLKSIVSTIFLLVSAFVIAQLLSLFVFHSYEVDGPSMQPTLQDQDRLLVLKTQTTWGQITNDPFIPSRGEIIVFNRSLGGTAEAGDKQLIKRVVGLPGEQVVLRGGVLTIYNDEHPEGFQPDETLPYGDSIKTTPGNVDLVVPPGEIFVAGDNRVNSQDSRFFGTVPAKDVVGTLYVRILPLDKARKF